MASDNHNNTIKITIKNYRSSVNVLKLNDKVISIQNLNKMYLKHNEKKNVTTLLSTGVHRIPAKLSIKQIQISKIVI